MPTDRESQVLDVVTRHIARYGVSPNLREIAEALGIQSRGVVHRYIRSLVKQGLLVRKKGRHRGIRLPESASVSATDSLALPLVGRIAAGKPLEAVAGLDTVNLNELFVRPGRYLVKVTGDSMRDAGILDGDLVVVDKRDTADIGQIVVALIDQQEATLKRLGSRRGGRVELRPANPDFQAQTYEAERVRIQGVVVGNVRVYSSRSPKR